jgi:predicted aconitase
VRLSDEEQGILAGAAGPAAQRALEQQVAVGRFFGAADFVPVSSVHLAADAEAMRDAGVQYLEEMVALGATCRVPTTVNPRSVELSRWAELGQDAYYVDLEGRIVRALEGLGALTLHTCVNYQIVSQPIYGEHLAWGDTGTVIWANSVAGARSNFEAGPAALHAAVTGRVPRYGYHLQKQRRGTALVRVRDVPATDADWGALGCYVGRLVDDYWQVPVLLLEGDPPPDSPRRPTADGLKQLGAALASYGSLALFHLVGVTPEARSVEDALQGHPAERELVVEPGALAATYASFVPQTEEVDLVVFGTPQLSLHEMRRLARLFQGRRVHPGTRVFLTTSDAVKAVADHLGYCAILEGAGATVLTGVCYYIMTAREMAARHGFRSLLTDSAKLANIIAGYGYVSLFRPTEVCVAAACTGRLGGGGG